MAGITGKRGWAIKLSTNSITQSHDSEQQTEHYRNKNTVSNVNTTYSESNVINLSSISASETTKKETKTNPFIHQVQFHGPQGEIVRVYDRAMKEVMSSEVFKRVKHRLGTTLLSSQLLRVENGTIVKSEAMWKGRIEVGSVQADVTFEVFDSGGKWDFLFGKTQLETFKEVHSYEKDRPQAHARPPAVCVVPEQHDPDGDEVLTEVYLHQESQPKTSNTTTPLSLREH